MKDKGRGGLPLSDRYAETKSVKKTIYTECILSQADVIKCWKGTIKSEEYILFLRKVKNSHFSEDQYVYIPVSMTYGKYRADTSMSELYRETQIGLDYMDNGESLSLQDAEKEEVLLFEKDKYQLYLNMKKAVMKKYL